MDCAPPPAPMTAAARVGSSHAARRRVVSVDYPPTWEPSYEGPSPCLLVPLAKTDGEYKRVEQLALRQQYTGGPRTSRSWR